MPLFLFSIAVHSELPFPSLSIPFRTYTKTVRTPVYSMTAPSRVRSLCQRAAPPPSLPFIDRILSLSSRMSKHLRLLACTHLLRALIVDRPFSYHNHRHPIMQAACNHPPSRPPCRVPSSMPLSHGRRHPSSHRMNPCRSALKLRLKIVPLKASIDSIDLLITHGL